MNVYDCPYTCATHAHVLRYVRAGVYVLCCVVVLRFYMVSVSMNAFLLIDSVYMYSMYSLCVQLLNKTIMLKQILADLYTYRMNVASIA